eukprot:TRINITY_DN20970_c0_g1_i1.p1 TRINITY_DN20970_c0_g1~~TRINITY_DN20970_c0_g1_i1.p1  ORF type:complete len:356 (+),score=75.45 TRINITY_DN20970_c0_g1_i1:45-1112(+)
MASEFWDSLPADGLLEEEEQLLDLLARIADLKHAFMPGDVSIQMWAERRMPEDFISLCNSSGLIFVKRAKKQEVFRSKGKLLVPARVAGSAPAAVPSTAARGAPMPAARGAPTPAARGAPSRGFEGAKADFLAQMPAELTPAEVALRDEIVNIIVCQQKQNVETISSSPVFMRQFRATFPNGIKVRDWVEHRLQGDVEVVVDPTCGHTPTDPMVKFVIKNIHDWAWEDKFQLRESVLHTWLASLPQDEFTPYEQTLRNVIVDHLTACEGNVDKLADILELKKVKQAKENFLPLSISITKWIENRIGEEVVFNTFAGGLIVVGLHGTLDNEEVISRLLAKKRKKGPEKGPEKAQES